MITWAERAKAAISQTGQGGTVKTDETYVSRLLAVSSVPSVAISSMPERLSTVLAVPSPVVFEKHDSSLAATEDPDGWLPRVYPFPFTTLAFGSLSRGSTMITLPGP